MKCHIRSLPSASGVFDTIQPEFTLFDRPTPTKYFRPSSRIDGTGEGRMVLGTPERDGRDRISNFKVENKFLVKN